MRKGRTWEGVKLGPELQAIRCLRPRWVEGPIPQYVACRRCSECLRQRSASWAARTEMEIDKAERAWWCTLTYAQSAVSDRSKADASRWLAKMRRGRQGIRYLMVYELGTRTGRPHWHAVLTESAGGDKLSRRGIEAAWPHGHGRVRLVRGVRVIGQSPGQDRQPIANYIAKYVTKTLEGQTDIAAPDRVMCSRGWGKEVPISLELRQRFVDAGWEDDGTNRPVR